MRAPFAATVLVLFGLTLVASPSLTSAVTAPDKKPAVVKAGDKKVSWLAFDAAAEQAKKENKHMIVDVYTTWCGWCKVMDRQTYSNAQVVDYLNQNFVLAKVNGESSAELHDKGEVMTERAFARKVGVTGFPTTYFLKPDAEIKRVLLCSGKVYYDLIERRAETGRDDVYILRLEQFYPWPMKSLSKELKRFKAAELAWVQEEPKNMGGWTFVDPWLELTLERLNIAAKRARYVGRPASASTAAGLMSRHLKELDTFLKEAFA